MNPLAKFVRRTVGAPSDAPSHADSLTLELEPVASARAPWRSSALAGAASADARMSGIARTTPFGGPARAAPVAPPEHTTMPMPLAPVAAPKLRLGDMLVEQELISQEQLNRALDEQRQTGKVLGRVLLDSGLVTDVQIAKAIARQLALEYVDLGHQQVNPKVASTISEANSRRLCAIVVSNDEASGVRVVLADPINMSVVDEIARLTRSSVNVCVGAESAIIDAIDRTFSTSTVEMAGLVQAVDNELHGAAQQLASIIGSSATTVDDESPVAKLVQMIIEQASRLNASDIHFEPGERTLGVRFRIDGQLRAQGEYPAQVAPAVTSRLKVLARLDIAQRRAPQDGRFTASTQRGDIDLRMSTLPCDFGESVVLRLLRQDTAGLEISQLGMSDLTLGALRASLARPSGLILVTGPTGSGKTTTLYAMLAALRDGQSKLITIEEPIEYRFAGITQVPVNPKSGQGFAEVLRASLRQDPDVVMVGEIRDALTAEIATKASMTGHLVLSTLHTNDAAATPPRLKDMGVESFLVASSLELVIAQRLVRRVCSQCAVEHTPTAQELAWLEARQSSLLDVDRHLMRRGRGCPACGGSGTRGRHAVYEHLCATPDLLRKFVSSTHHEYQHAANEQMHGRSLTHDTLRLVRSGTTPLSEAMRIDGSIVNSR